MKAIVYGEVIWDVYPDARVIGGAPFNFCAHLAHLGSHALLISALGDDALGADARLEMQKHGIDAAMVQASPYPTGVCRVTLNEEKIPTFSVLQNVSYDHIALSDRLLGQVKAEAADVFYFNTLIQRHEHSRKTLRALLDASPAKMLFCDVNLRPNCFDRESLLLCLTRSTVLKISEEEAHFLFDLGILLRDEAKPLPIALAERFPNLSLILYTLGKKGSTVYDCAAKKSYASPTPAPVEVVSTVGAGDCFGATFLHFYCKDKNIPNAIEQATARCSLVVASKEAVPF